MTVVKEKGYLNYFIKLFIQRFSYIPKLHTTKGGKNESIIPSQKKIYKYTCDIPKKKILKQNEILATTNLTTPEAAAVSKDKNKRDFARKKTRKNNSRIKHFK